MNINQKIRGIFIRSSEPKTGQPVFLGQAQEFREFQDRVELWENDTTGQPSMVMAWPKQMISHIEFKDVPNVWFTLNPTIRI